MSQEVIDNRLLYPVSIVAGLLGIRTQTLSAWERRDVVHPQKINGKLFYLNSDLSRLRFVHKLTEERLNKAAICRYVNLYPCWSSNKCLTCMHISKRKNGGKPCWKKDGFYCVASYDENLCSDCEFNCR
ncbi:MerR family transcriptional regulator [Chloroflexota bacterium]